MINRIIKRIFAQNSVHLLWRRALSPTARSIFTPTALVLLTNFNIILALISPSLLTLEFLLDFHYLFHHNCVFISGNKSYASSFLHFYYSTAVLPVYYYYYALFQLTISNCITLANQKHTAVSGDNQVCWQPCLLKIINTKITKMRKTAITFKKYQN